MRSALPDPSGLREAASLTHLAAVRYSTGAYEEAGTLYERALAIWEKALGPDHPEVAMSINNLALVCNATGAFSTAVASSPDTNVHDGVPSVASFVIQPPARRSRPRRGAMAPHLSHSVPGTAG